MINTNPHLKRKLREKKTKKKEYLIIKGTHNNKQTKDKTVIELIMYKHYAKMGDNDPTLNPNQAKLCRCIKYEVANADNSLTGKDIEMLKCNKPVMPGTDFCKDHQNCLGYLRKYLSGFEPPYNPKAWAHPYIEGSHNCYAYFLDDRKESLAAKCEEFCLKNNKKGCPKKDDECQELIPQPGDNYLLHNQSSLDKKERKYTCPNMVNKILADNPSIKPSHLLEKCPANYYKGAMTVDTGSTFHFYRQNPDGTWSHKPGILPVSNVDASGKKIYMPHFANRNYADTKDGSNIKYDAFCGYFCIPSNKYYETNLA